MTGRHTEIIDAAGQFASAGRYSDAGKHILQSLNIAPHQVSSLDGANRKLAYLCATYFAKADEFDTAIELFLALGENHKAADLLEKKGDLLNAEKVRQGRMGKVESLSSHRGSAAVGGEATSRYTAQRLEREGKTDSAIQLYFQLKLYNDAGRLLKQQGKTHQAANMFAEGGNAYDAAVCFLELGDTGKGLDNLVRVSRDHPNYRVSAIKAISVAHELNTMTFQIDNFLSEFIRTAPKDAREREALYFLGRLYETHGFEGNARDAFGRIAQASSGYKDVAKRIERLDSLSAASKDVYRKIRADEASFRGEIRRISPGAALAAAGFSDPSTLPELPPLPNLPALRHSNIAGPSNFEHNAVHPTPSTGQVDDFRVGITVANRYRIEAEIGRGGMAAVYRALDMELEEQVALKVFLTQILEPFALAESEQRFKQELKLSRKLSHKNVIRLHDIGVHQGHRYISMELLKGKDLDHRLGDLGRPLDFASGIHLLIQSAAGLQVAHDQGVVHRDIKPENLFVTDDGVVKVMDFGIARNTVKAGLTMEGMLAGTPHYMAPEQISSFSTVTPSADLYSLGLVAYKMFTLTLPFDHEDLTKLMMMHISEAPRSPRTFNPEIPADLEYVIMRLLKKEPSQRYVSARELASALQEVYKRIKS